MDFSWAWSGLADKPMFVLVLEGSGEGALGNKKMIKIQPVPDAHAKFIAQDVSERIWWDPPLTAVSVTFTLVSYSVGV